MPASVVPPEFTRKVREAELIKTHCSLRKTGRWKLILECSHTKFSQGTLPVPKMTRCFKCWAVAEYPATSNALIRKSSRAVTRSTAIEQNDFPVINLGAFDTLDAWFTLEIQSIVSDMGKCALADDSARLWMLQQRLGVMQTYRRQSELLRQSFETALTESTMVNTI
jgi:hypothetical protein